MRYVFSCLILSRRNGKCDFYFSIFSVTNVLIPLTRNTVTIITCLCSLDRYTQFSIKKFLGEDFW